MQSLALTWELKEFFVTNPPAYMNAVLHKHDCADTFWWPVFIVDGATP